MNGPTEQIKPTPVKAGGTECGRIDFLGPLQNCVSFHKFDVSVFGAFCPSILVRNSQRLQKEAEVINYQEGYYLLIGFVQ